MKYPSPCSYFCNWLETDMLSSLKDMNLNSIGFVMTLLTNVEDGKINTIL